MAGTHPFTLKLSVSKTLKPTIDVTNLTFLPQYDSLRMASMMCNTLFLNVFLRKEEGLMSFRQRLSDLYTFCEHSNWQMLLKIGRNDSWCDWRCFFTFCEHNENRERISWWSGDAYIQSSLDSADLWKLLGRKGSDRFWSQLILLKRMIAVKTLKCQFWTCAIVIGISIENLKH